VGTAVSATPHTEEVARSVVDALLQIAYQKELLPYIPLDIWSWLKTRPSLPPGCVGCFFGSFPGVIKAVQGLKDVELLESYLVLVWSEWGAVSNEGFDEMCVSLPKDFGEIGMGHHRANLIERLDHILGQLDLEYLQ